MSEYGQHSGHRLNDPYVSDPNRITVGAVMRLIPEEGTEVSLESILPYTE